MTSVAYNNFGMLLMSVGMTPVAHQWRTHPWYATDAIHICGVPVFVYAMDEVQEVSGQMGKNICGVPLPWYATDVIHICGVPRVRHRYVAPKFLADGKNFCGVGLFGTPPMLFASSHCMRVLVNASNYIQSIMSV